MNPILKKLFFKNQGPVLLLNLPPELQKLSKEFGAQTHTSPTGKYGFILAFVTSLAEGEKLAKRLPKHLDEKTVVWVAYPKGTSKKYKSDYNRDRGHALMISRQPGSAIVFRPKLRKVILSASQNK